MDIKFLRTVHLYLGCIFTPLLLFFAISGVFQTFELHEARKDGYQPPPILSMVAEIHKHQHLPDPEDRRTSSKGFQLFVVLMTIGFTVTSILGVMMAFKFAKPLVVVGCLLAGILIPAFCIYFFGR